MILRLAHRHCEREKAKYWLSWTGMQDSKGSDGGSDGPNNDLCSAAYDNVEVSMQSTKTGLCYISRGLVAHGKVDIKGKVYDCLITIARRFLPPMAFMLTRACIGPSSK